MKKSIELLQQAFELYKTPKDQQSMFLGILHFAKSEAYNAGMDWQIERQREHDEELERIEMDADMRIEEEQLNRNNNGN